MITRINAILIHGDDNVVTLTTAVEKGGVAAFQKGDEIIELKVAEDIPVFHKVALSEIEKGASVYKYGQLIGTATVKIVKGTHVHDHNIASPSS